METTMRARIGTQVSRQHAIGQDKCRNSFPQKAAMQKMAGTTSFRSIRSQKIYAEKQQPPRTGPSASQNNTAASPTNAPLELAQRLLASVPELATENTKIWGVVSVLAATALLATPEAALAADHVSSNLHAAHPIADIAENEDFWANVLRYISYFFSVLLGTAYVALRPLVDLMKRPTTAVLVILGAAGLYFFVSTTVGAMLGINDVIEYEPSSIVTPMQ